MNQQKHINSGTHLLWKAASYIAKGFQKVYVNNAIKSLFTKKLFPTQTSQVEKMHVFNWIDQCEQIKKNKVDALMKQKYMAKYWKIYAIY